MSIAREKALKFYPILFSERNGYDETNIQEERRNSFENGYEECLKDSALKWQDIRRIITIANNLLNRLDYDKIKKMGEEGYYTEILNRFNEGKNY